MSDQALTPRQMGEVAAAMIGEWLQAEQVRARYGAAARAANLKALHAGEAASGYRAEWVVGSARKVAELVSELGKEFGRTFCWDKANLPDLIDILVTAQGMLTGAADRDGTDGLTMIG